MKNRILSVIIAIVMIVGLLSLPAATFAQESETDKAPIETESQPENTQTEEQSESEAPGDDELNEDTFENYMVHGMVDSLEQSYRFEYDRENIYKSIVSRLLAKNPELMDDAMRAIFDQLDMHSEYYTPEEYAELMEYLTNSFCGIGVVISEVEEGLLVLSVLPNSPASKNGVMVGDVIVSADGVSLAGLSTDEAKKLIVGEEGTSVVLGMYHNGAYTEKTMVRAQVENVSGYYDFADDEIGYIYLSSFDGHCNKFITEALAEFDKKNITKIIIDLRNNPGGSLTEYVDVCQHFIPKGPVISLDYKDPSKNEVFYSENENPKYTLAVLINENSASASEAFSGAVQDTGVGVVIGSKSFGKGTKQFVSRIWTGGGVKVTDAEYLTAGGRHINDVGIYPDIDIENKPVKYSKDLFGVLTIENKLKLGDRGEEVVKCKRRLDALGFDVGYPENDLFDEKMWAATESFQRATDLFPYGVMDFNTQLMMENILNNSNVYPDIVLKEAVKVLKDGSWENFKGEGIYEVKEEQ